jgi:hypothetical protein
VCDKLKTDAENSSSALKKLIRFSKKMKLDGYSETGNQMEAALLLNIQNLELIKSMLAEMERKNEEFLNS